MPSLNVECYALWMFPLPGGNCSEWFSGTWSALAVAIAAGTYGISELRLNRERRDREKAVARQIGMKLFRLMNEANNLLRLIRPRTMPEDTSFLEFDYRDVHPLVGAYFDATLQLDAVELDLLSRANDPEFMMDFMLSLERHRTIIDSLHEYKVRYEGLQTMMPTPAGAEGTMMKYEISKEEALKLTPYMLSINSILNALIGMVRENTLLCDRLVDRYTSLMKKHLKVKKWMAIVRVESP